MLAKFVMRQAACMLHACMLAHLRCGEPGVRFETKPVHGLLFGPVRSHTMLLRSQKSQSPVTSRGFVSGLFIIYDL